MKRLYLFVVITFVVAASAVLCAPGTALAEEPILVINSSGHMGAMRYLMFTQDGRYLVSISGDKTVRVWDVTTGETVRVLRGQIGGGTAGSLSAAALSSDDRLLAVGGGLTGTEEEQWAIRLIDFQTGEVTALLKGHEDKVGSLAFSPDGKKLLSGSSDNTARIWDVQTEKTLHVLEGHTELIRTVAFSPDGKRAVTGSADHTLKLWNVKSGTLITTLAGHEDKIGSVAFTPNGNYLLSGGKDKTIRLWDVKSGKFLKVLAKQDSMVVNLSISPDGTKVVAGRLEPPHSVFSIPSGKQITTFTKPYYVYATAISPDGNIAATGGGNDHEIYLWDMKTAQVKQRMVGKGKSVWTVGFAKDGKTIAWGKGSLEQAFQLEGEDGTFNLALGRELQDDSGYLQEIESVGPWSLRTKNDDNKTLQILKNGKVVHEITRDSWHESFTLTPDGKTAISGGGAVTAYDPQTGEKIHDFVGHLGAMFGVAVSPDSRWLVSGSVDQTVKLWEIATGKLLLTIFHGRDNEWVAWIPEGYYTCSVKGDRYIGWHINQGVDKAALYYPASKFAKQFYSPEVVAAYLETGGDLEGAIRLTNERKQGRQKVEETSISEILKLMPPVVFFQDPEERDVAVTEGQIRIKAGAKSVNQEPITDIWVLVNGKRTRGLTIVKEDQEKPAQKTIEGLRAAIEQTISLTQAENKISVIAANQHTQSEPETIVVRWEHAGKQPIEEIYKPNLYLLAIGVSEYQDPDYNLGVAHKDAEAVAAVFEGQRGKLYQKVDIRLLTNQQATQDNILDGLDWILRESTQKDLSLLFVSGHGLKDERGNYYFLPYDGDPENIRRTGVLWFNFQDVLTGLPSKVIFMVDTCHSGSITGKRREVTDLTDALRELVHAESGVVVMTASTGKEFSVEKPEWGHGAFTKAVVEGLEGKANYNNDSTIDIKELDLFITNRVKELTQGYQHPTTEIPKTMPNFPVVYR